MRSTLAGTDAHLILAGPECDGVADDPEAQGVLDECRVEWRALAGECAASVFISRVYRWPTPAKRPAIVNAIQRHAAVVVQKSLAEGFGLTVAEAMWKGRPVVASAVGGIVDQIVSGKTGWLVEDPLDLDEYAQAVGRLLADPAGADRMGAEGRQRVRTEFLRTVI